MLKETIENRKKYVEALVKQGMKSNDIARFYEIPPSMVRHLLKEMDITEDDSVSLDPNEVEMLLNARDKLIAKQIAKGYTAEEALLGFGFHSMPQYTAITNALLEEKIKEFGIPNDYSDLLLGKSIKEMALEKNCSQTELKERLSKYHLKEKDLEIYSKEFLKYKKYCEIAELARCGFTAKEIARLCNVTELMAANIIKEIKKSGLRERRKDLIREALLNGENKSDISKVFGISLYNMEKLLDDSVTALKEKNTECPYDYKTEHRRELIFKMYNEDKMTGQEIADALGLSRTTVVTDIQKYERMHPDKVDATILWQQRNLAKADRERRQRQKESFIQMIQDGSSIVRAAEDLSISYDKAQRFLDEEGICSKTQERIQERQSIISSGLRNGIPIEAIAKANNWTVSYVERETRALLEACQNELERMEECKMAHNYPPYAHRGPTTSIMNHMGKTRPDVLDDQHKTSNYLKHNAKALNYMKAHAGDISPFSKAKEMITIAETREERD